MNILCVDIGTSSLKAALINEKGQVLHKSRRKFLLVNTQHSSKEWFPALSNAIQEIFEKIPDDLAESKCYDGKVVTL